MNAYENICCPWCFQNFEIASDWSGGNRQQFIIDCEVCCRPMEVIQQVDDDGLVLLDINRC